MKKIGLLLYGIFHGMWKMLDNLWYLHFLFLLSPYDLSYMSVNRVFFLICKLAQRQRQVSVKHPWLVFAWQGGLSSSCYSKCNGG